MDLLGTLVTISVSLGVAGVCPLVTWISLICPAPPCLAHTSFTALDLTAI